MQRQETEDAVYEKSRDQKTPCRSLFLTGKLEDELRGIP